MTATPCCLAYDSMCAPTPESSGSTTSTLAPLVMADWAMLNWVASWPRAVSTVRLEDDRPASANACFRADASNSTSRVEETVSGRITVTLPLPAAATDLSPDMAEKVLFRSLTEIDAVPVLAEADAGGAPAARDGPELLLELLELRQRAATSSAAAAAAAVRPARADTEYNG